MSTPITFGADAVPDRFVEAVSQSHRMELLLQVLDGNTGELLRSLDTVNSGTVTLDGSAAIMGRVELELIDDGGLVPLLQSDDLAPYGNEFQVGRGIRYPDGTAEVVLLGKFPIRRVDSTDSEGGRVLKITALDRWSRFVDARFEGTWVVPAGTNYIDAIVDTATECWPELEHDLGITFLTTPLLVAEAGEDRGEFLQKLAAGLGQKLYFDGDGFLRMEPIVNFNATVDWTISDGEGGVLIEAAKAWDSERIYNRVIVTGEAVDDQPPVRGVATDENPASATYYYGEFGKRPRFYASSFITTEAQAKDAAAAILASSLGATQQVEFGAIVNPAIRPSSLVDIKRESLGINQSHFIDAVTIPLTAGEPMTGRTRVFDFEGE